MNNKRGSSAVFLTIILAALMTITIGLIYGVKAAAARSSADAIINLAADSVLSEYGRNLQKEYGLFLINGTDNDLSQKLHGYISYSFDDMEDVNIDSLKVSGARYSVVNTAIIKEQIIEHMRSLKKSTQGGGETDTGDGTETEYRTLRHGPTIVSLPSSNIPDKGLTAMAEELADKKDGVSEAFVAGSENYVINQYVLKHFNSKNKTINSTHFFSNEVEYILGGELSDSKNEKRVEMALKAMRFPINMAYLYTDAEKQAALATAAQLMTPGASAVVTQAALASTWAYAEADNDVELLWQGKKVPMVKDDATWAVDLDSAIEGVFGGTVQPAQEKGYNYNEYLQILLFFRDENVKLARILDLIQINMRAEFDETFLISEHAAGISVKVKVNGKNHTYEKKY